MELPPLPPSDDICAALKVTVLPAAGAAAFTCALVLAIDRRLGALASALAILAGLAYANWVELRLPWNPDPAKSVSVAWEWLPRAVVLLVAVGLGSRWLGLALNRWPWLAILAVWLPRLAATIPVAFWLVPERVREPEPWLLPAFASIAFLDWVILDGLARARDATLPFDLAAMMIAASVVILYSHSARFMDVAAMAGAAFFAIGAVARAARPAEVSGAIPAGVALLPGLLLSTHVSTENLVPRSAYLLVALAPLTLAPWLIPALARRTGPLARIARLAILLLPLILAGILAGRVESLPWEAEW